MLAIKRSAGVAPVVNLRIHCMQAMKYSSKGSTLALKPREDVTRIPNQGYQWTKKKDFSPPKIERYVNLPWVSKVQRSPWEVSIWGCVRVVGGGGVTLRSNQIRSKKKNTQNPQWGIWWALRSKMQISLPFLKPNSVSVLHHRKSPLQRLKDLRSAVRRGVPACSFRSCSSWTCCGWWCCARCPASVCRSAQPRSRSDSPSLRPWGTAGCTCSGS